MNRSRFAGVAVAIAVIAGLVQIGTPAEASFPGKNGLIATTNGANVFLVDVKHGTRRQITTAGNIIDVNFSADGKKIVIGTATGLAIIKPKAHTAITPIPGTTAADHDPAFDPTGKKITFDNGGDIFTASVHDATTRTNLTGSTPDFMENPNWSPDGRFIVFTDDTNFNIDRIQADGTLFKSITSNAGCSSSNTCQHPNVSPDSTHVVFEQDGSGTNGIYQVLADGTSKFPFRFTTGNDDLAVYAPNGKSIAYQNSASLVTIVPPDGSNSGTPIAGALTGFLSWGRVPKHH